MSSRDRRPRRPSRAPHKVPGVSAPIDTVRETMVEAKRHYEKAGKPELLDYQEFDGGHEWRGDIAWKFLAKYL